MECSRKSLGNLEYPAGATDTSVMWGAVEQELLQGIGGKEDAHLDGPDGEALSLEPRSSPVRNWALPRPNDQSLSVFSTMLTITSVGGMPHERSSSAQSFR